MISTQDLAPDDLSSSTFEPTHELLESDEPQKENPEHAGPDAASLLLQIHVHAEEDVTASAVRLAAAAFVDAGIHPADVQPLIIVGC